jgi:hypothetical protein
MGTFHTRSTSHQPSILVGWAAGVLQMWPEESAERYELRGARPATSPDEILDALAAADGMDPADYAARHVADAPALLALTHHSMAAILAAALQVPDELAPGAVLAVLEGRAPRQEPAFADRQSALTILLAS